VFLQEYPDLLADLERAVADRNREGIRQAAHKLKGAIAPFARKDAYRAGYQLENTSATAPWPDLENHLAELKLHLGRLVPALTAHR
jgi:HPt (histidine-containing phosphotransfer) domain-containing protein